MNMSSSIPFPGSTDCNVFETPQVSQARKRTHHGSITNLHSHKRRRISMASGDFQRELSLNTSVVYGAVSGNSIDRFVPSRPKTALPLDVTPRTKRISKQFGLTDERVFNFRDENESPSKSFDNTLHLLRKSASSLFDIPPPRHLSSVTENLSKRKQCQLTLDSPGISHDPQAFPISLSRQNLIAVACGRSVFYQNLETKVVRQLRGMPTLSKINAIEWGMELYENYIAIGTFGATVQLWDVGNNGIAAPVSQPPNIGSGTIKSVAWNRSLLCVGSENGTVALLDVRAKSAWSKNTRHRHPVLGLKWSMDGNYLASSDEDGIVHIWDKRAAKSLLDLGQCSPKIRHKGAAVKALAWCDWKPDLLATGSLSPEGKICVWSTSCITSAYPEPLEVIPLKASVYSLHWSLHCRELLSTQGSAFRPAQGRRSSVPTASSSSVVAKDDLSPLKNSIAVHDYPSGKRLLTLTNAHSKSVTHSCLSADGENLFSVCPKEEAIKSWHVWTKRPKVEKEEGAFDRCSIR